MKKITIFALAAVLAVSLCACRMDKNTKTTTAPTTVPATTKPVTTTVPIIPDPTIETNIPDTSVDDKHLIDTTHGTEGEHTPATSEHVS